MAAATAGTLVLATTPAFADLPGEDAEWSNEMVDGQAIGWLRYSPAEAYTSGNDHLAALVGGDGRIFTSLNNGPVREVLAGARTIAPVVVTQYGENDFALFHTGTDGRIYWTTISATTHDTLGQWRVVPNQETGVENSVSVVTLGSGRNHFYMVYRGGDTGRIMGTYWDGSQWSVHNVIGGGSNSYTAPAIAVNGSRLYAAHRGVDNRVYIAHQVVGSGDWSSWRDIGGAIHSQLSIASLQNGHMLVAGDAEDGTVWYHRLSWDGYTLNNGYWEQESQHVHIQGQGPSLVSNGQHSTIYLLALVATDAANALMWKRAYRE
ncbi:hypothetical protein [Streptomyces sp. NPDC088733]|uniref:hypothetical protein n=1 Tax=Streptomyces sp. NPDC088733 TaxID=3365880 RepID=UPI0038202EA7